MMRILEPGYIGKVKLKNRIQMAPMGLGGALYQTDGKLSQRGIDYFLERAKNGIGLIRVGYTRTNKEFELPRGTVFTRYPFANDRLQTSWLVELAERIHDYRAKASIQLTAGMGRIAGADIQNNGRPIAPSGLTCFWPPHKMTEELSTGEVERLISYFAVAAKIVKDAGFDMIELHGHEGYLMDQFKTALWNKRTDKYGGSLENRLRFSTEIIQAIKDKAGTDFPIIYRFGLTHFYEGGRTIDEGLEIAKLLEKAGADALDIDAGCYETWYHPHPPTTMPAGLHTELAARVKQEVSIPVIAVSKLGNPLLAEQVLQQGMADFIALGRPLLADPEWLVKVKDCKPEDIRPCVGCHEGCLARIYAGKYNSCTVNPATGMERDFVITKAEKSKQVLIIGGGPAGMEAARVSALRGHKVMLWEKDDCLGGNFRIKSVPAFKDEYAQFTRYQEQQLKKLSVSVILNRTAVAEDIIKENPDVVYIATGAAYKTPDLPGKELQHVLKPLQALSGLIPSAHQVVIIGGNLAGAEVALYLAQTGCRVILVEMTDTIACDCFIANRMHLMVLLEETGVQLMTSTEAKAITETEVIVSYNNKDLHLQADRVVMATGAAADRELYNQLEGKIMELYDIGDCIKPGKLINAIWDAYRTARLV